MQNTPYLFVYGSLRSGFKNSAYAYLSRYFKYLGEATIQGQFFEQNGTPVALPSQNESFIIGELYCLHSMEEFSWAFEQIDDYEGLHVEPGETPLYKREIVEVQQNGNVLPAWVYWYNGDATNLTPLPTSDLIKYLQQKL